MMFGHSLSSAERPAVGLGAPVLRVEGLTIPSYRLTVENAELQVRAGEVVGLAGLEGSGQRLFMHACTGLKRLTAGHILLDGQDMTGAPYRRFLDAGVAYMPAGRLEEGLIGGLTLTEHFALAERERSLFIDWTAARTRASQRIDRFNVVGQPETPVQALSGGNQQRVLLALLPPGLRLLLMERPTRGLDIESARWVWQQLLARREEGTAIIFTSADLDELRERSDRIVVFYGGRMMPPVETSRTTVEQLGYLIAGKTPDVEPESQCSHETQV
jgi:simple sugar transport system ATP-binding protein